MKTLRITTISLIALLSALSIRADWTSVKFIDRVNTAVQNGNIGPAMQPIIEKARPLSSGWTSVNFIDRVNAWQERMPKKPMVVQAEPVIMQQPQELVQSPIATNHISFAEKAKALFTNTKNITVNMVKNAYNSDATQNLLKSVQANKKVIAGVAVGTVALYGAYKFYSYVTDSSKKEIASDESAMQEQLFQEQYQKLNSKQARLLVQSMNEEAQTSIIMQNQPGALKGKMQGYNSRS